MRSLPLLAAALALAAHGAACRRAPSESAATDAATPEERLGPVRIENLLGLELTLPAGWRRAPAEAQDAAHGILFRARRAPVAARELVVAPSLVVARPAATELEAAVSAAVAELQGLERQRGVELEKTSSAVRTLGGRSFRLVEASYRVGGAGAKSASFVQRSFFLATPEGPPGAQLLAFHLSHLAEDAEALGTELDVVLSGLQLTGPRLAAPGQTPEAGLAEEEE